MRAERFALLIFVPLHAPEGARAAYVPGEVLVRFSPVATDAERSSLRATMSDSVLARFPTFGIEHLRLRDATVADAVARHRGHPTIALIEPNYVGRLASTFPNDPLFDQQWPLHNTNGLDADIDAPEAWDIFTGDPTLRIAVLDTGCDYTHPDLASNIWTNAAEAAGTAGVDDDGNGYVDDIHGYDFVDGDGDPINPSSLSWHGTHVAGIVAARGNNGIGISGVAWRAEVVVVRVVGEMDVTVANGLAGIQYALRTGARITNNSYVFDVDMCSTALEGAIITAGQAGQLYVAAAGNAPRDIDVAGQEFYAASFTTPYVVTVTGSTNTDDLYTWAYGAKGADLYAPGFLVRSTVPNTSYGVLSGTSMAAPHVSGTAALLLGNTPSMPILQAKARIMAGVDAKAMMSTKCLSGGRLNAHTALAGPGPGTDETAPAAATLSAIVGRSAAVLTWTAPGDDGWTGTATSYELRYAPYPITEEVFGSASLAGCFGSGPLFPKHSGSAECVEVGPLTCGITYYFALRTYDDVGNVSAISNVVSGSHACVGGNPACEMEESHLAALAMPLESFEDDPIRAVTMSASGATLDLAFRRDRVGERLRVDVFDVQGRCVRELHDDLAVAHEAHIFWSFKEAGLPVGQGVYFLRVQLGGREWTRPLVVLH